MIDGGVGKIAGLSNYHASPRWFRQLRIRWEIRDDIQVRTSKSPHNPRLRFRRRIRAIVPAPTSISVASPLDSGRDMSVPAVLGCGGSACGMPSSSAVEVGDAVRFDDALAMGSAVD